MALMQTILVVDDEPQIVQLVRDYLEHGGFKVLAATDGPAALRTAATQHPDLVVLDLGLPGLDGLDVTRSLRRNGAVPIIMLTARADESDKLVGLELGADDYLTKPFSPKELVARVRSVLRRSEAAREPADLIRAGDVELNIPSMRLTIAGRRVELTPTEVQLGAAMARARLARRWLARTGTAAVVAARRGLATGRSADVAPDGTPLHVAGGLVHGRRLFVDGRGSCHRRRAGRDRGRADRR